MTDAPKCQHCGGYAFEPDVVPLAPCTACAGTGRAAGPVPAFLTNRQQKELIAHERG